MPCRTPWSGRCRFAVSTPNRSRIGRARRAQFPTPAVSVPMERPRCEAGVGMDDLMTRARTGDGAAFRELVAPYERELEIHCYRFLGSAADAQDALQETLLAAWQGLGGFEERSSIRTWLYRVATSRCLNALRSRKRRPRAPDPPPDFHPPEPTRLVDVGWLEPYPDMLLEGLPDDTPGPDARYETH